MCLNSPFIFFVSFFKPVSLSPMSIPATRPSTGTCVYFMLNARSTVSLKIAKTYQKKEYGDAPFRCSVEEDSTHLFLLDVISELDDFFSNYGKIETS